MPDPTSRFSRLFALWITLVLAAAGWVSPGSAQQAAPNLPGASGVALQSGTVTAKDAAVDPAATPGASNFQKPKVLKHPSPGYPELAHLNRVEGVVRIRFAIDDAGIVTGTSLVKSSGSVMLDNVVRDHTLREWTFQPALLNGQPVAGGVEKEFEFRLDPKEQRDLAEKRLALSVGTPDPPYPPEALTAHPPPTGKCTIGVRWTKAGLVDLIYLVTPSGSTFLDHTALRFAYANWRTDTATASKDEAFTKEVTFTPPAAP